MSSSTDAIIATSHTENRHSAFGSVLLALALLLLALYGALGDHPDISLFLSLLLMIATFSARGALTYIRRPVPLHPPDVTAVPLLEPAAETEHTRLSALRSSAPPATPAQARDRCVSLADLLVLFGMATLGAPAAAALAFVQAFFSARRQHLSTLTLFANLLLSSSAAYVAGRCFSLLANHYAQQPALTDLQRNISTYGLPILAAAAISYLVQYATARLLHLPSLWLPGYFLIAAVTGFIHYGVATYGLLATASILVLVLPVPLLIYYTFKAQRDRLEDQRREAELREAEVKRRLEQTLKELKILKGFLFLCPKCRRIQTADGQYEQIEQYLMANSEAEFSHSLCDDCVRRLYPDIADDVIITDTAYSDHVSSKPS